MDPTANLKAQRNAADQIVKLQEKLAKACDDRAADEEIRSLEGGIVDHAANLASLVVALDDWIKGGGFLPAQWSK